ncbi:MAG: response regulator transcription factor [Lachnospiraceae bacterium]|nr:response regulator transcription factor [Lachnospiraceae bacterium]MDE7029855.1 response regulator transcription factor [Lachnospiraceae bacterium]
MTYQILLIEDDLQICEIITDYLTAQAQNTFDVRCAGDGQEGFAKIVEGGYDLVLLDIMLPGMDGFALCRELRRRSDAPIIFITARGREEDKLRGYHLGCDDYLVKPFSLPVLHAKMLALLKRSKGMVQHAVLTAGSIVLDPERYRVSCKGSELELSCKEYELLKYLMEHKGRVCAREVLLTHIWGYDFEGNDRVVDNHVRKLRKKLGAQGRQIRTIIRKGYQMKEGEDDYE